MTFRASDSRNIEMPVLLSSAVYLDFQPFRGIHTPTHHTARQAVSILKLLMVSEGSGRIV
jgi:hypothetical protein